MGADVIPGQIVAPRDYEAHAREHLSEAAWAYIDGGAGEEITAADNIKAFRRVDIRPRVLRNLVGGTTALTLLGHELPYPIMLAPTAFHRLVHPEGEKATAMGAAAMQACMVVSTQASMSVEDIAHAGGGPLWFQLYMQAGREAAIKLVRRAEAAGCEALVLTVDAPIQGLRFRERRAGFSMPKDIRAVNLAGLEVPRSHTSKPGLSPVFGSSVLAQAPTWVDLEWLVQQTTLPVVVKGITHPDDARLARDHGAAGIIVSNHGGRILDGMPATLDVLPSIVDAVGEDLPVLMDGGIRHGSDVFKALALGAQAVLIGRPYLYALATAGATGVAHLLHMLRTELEMTMALAGCACLADIRPTLLSVQPCSP